MSYIFSSESVSKGHPDKVADYIADSILDYCLSIDPNSRTAIEVALANQSVFICGEVNTKADLSYDNVVKIAKEAIAFCGYGDPKFLFDLNQAKFTVEIHQQSSDIAMGLDESNGKEQGAGDQGIMFGFAKDDTEALLPLPIYLAHRLTEKISQVREKGIIKGLGPDAKSQVSVLYSDDHKPLKVTAVVLSTQHEESKSMDELKNEVIEKVIKTVIPSDLLDVATTYYINPTGRFVIGGPVGDSGLTGRKLIVDTYGGYSRHGGGAFSGKDASKVDRSASYMARYLAKQVVASGIAKTCEIQLAYAIGVAEPVSIYVNTFNTGLIEDKKIEEIIVKNFKLTPKAIIEKLQLKKPIYKGTVHNGHFGKDGNEFKWEDVDSLDVFKNALNK